MPCSPECRQPHGRQAHCSVCHRTFTTLGTFDQHRTRGNCDLGTTLSEKDGLWGNWGTANGKKWWTP